MSKRISKAKKNKALARLMKGDSPASIAKDLQLHVTTIYGWNHANKKESNVQSIVKRTYKKTKDVKVKMTKDSLANGTPKQKLDALIKYLGKEALKTLMDD